MPPAIVVLAVRSVEMGRSPGSGLRPGPVTAVEPMLAPVLALVLLVLRRFDSAMSSTPAKVQMPVVLRPFPA